MKLTYKNGVFVPSEAVHVPEGYVVDVSLPGLTPEGNLQGSAAAARELRQVLAALAPLTDEDKSEWDRVMAEGKRSPSKKGIFTDVIEGDAA